MEIGDRLIVPHEVAPFGKTYSYVKSYGHRLARHFRIEKEEGGCIVSRVASAAEGRVNNWGEPKADRPPEGDWGTIRRQKNERWKFPWKHMEPGDVFRVNHGDIPYAELSKRARRAGWELKKHFHVTDRPIKAREYLHVECLAERRVGYHVVNFGTIRDKLFASYITDNPLHMVDPETGAYQLELSKVPWNSQPLGKPLTVEAQKIEDTHRNSYVFEALVSTKEEPIARPARFAVDMYDDRIVIERVGDDMTVNLWEIEKHRRTQEALS